jgi:hypothetical protein
MDILERLNRHLRQWLMKMHGPFDVDGNGARFVCRACRKPWPCDAWVRLVRQPR